MAEAVRLVGRGVFPAPGPISVVAPPPHVRAAVVAFSGHTYIAADVDPREVARRIGDDPYSGPVHPRFVTWLADEVGAEPGIVDVVLVAPGLGTRSPELTPEPQWRSHPRAGHGSRLRREVTGWSYLGGRGMVLLGRGLFDRWEVAYEADPHAPAGTGRALAYSARTLVGDGDAVFAQVAAGHTRSLRAAVAAGYQPIGSEILFSHPPGIGQA